MVTDWTRSYTQQEVVVLCEKAEVPCGIVAAIDEIFEDPQYAARENIVRIQDPRVGEIAVPNVVPRLTGTPGSVDTLGPALGAHNNDVYSALLGLSDTEIEELGTAGVI
jgi:crotonobetainyl-CoA:carnitine CoA-transferase CaiB-like acyl-CoA transferase